MKLLLVLLKNDRTLVSLSALIGLFSGLLNARLIQIAANNLPKAGNHDGDLAWVFGSLTLAVFLTGILSRFSLTHLSEKFSYNLRLNMCGQIFDMSLRDIEKRGLAKLITAFTQDIPAISQALLQVPLLFINAAITLGCLVYLGFLSPFIMLFLTGFFFVAIISYMLPEKIAIKYMDRNRQAWDTLIQRFNALTDGIKELKLHYNRADHFFNDHLRSGADEVRQSGIVNQAFYLVLDNWAQLLYFVFLGCLLFVLPIFGETTIEAIVGFSLVVLYVAGPIAAMVDVIPLYRRAVIGFNKLEKIGVTLDGSEKDPFADRDTVLAEIQALPELESLSLHNITHTFYREKEDSHFTLGPVNFQVQAGETCFIVGGNGSGKTTLAKLITGLYEPESGVIHVNGEAIEPARLPLYRQYFSAIFTDFFVFETILGMETGGLDNRARYFLEKLHLDHKVTIENGRLSTTSLSTGQRKRLALLTAFLEDRPIYLFDEWAADQDPEFKEVFYRQLLPELKARGKTVFCISHDDRYFDVADHFIKMADGKVVQERRSESSHEVLEATATAV